MPTATTINTTPVILSVVERTLFTAPSVLFKAFMNLLYYTKFMGIEIGGLELLLALIGVLLAAAVPGIGLTVYIVRREGRQDKAFEDIRSGFRGVDEQTSMLIKAQAERDKAYRLHSEKVLDTLNSISNRAGQNSQLQKDLISAIKDLNSYIVEADRRSTSEHTELLTLVRSELSKR